MIRRVIMIDSDRCSGCGLCVSACHEGAITLTDGKAKLLREDFCDGFGDCLPACPMDAISFIEKDAPAYDEEAVNENKRKKAAGTAFSSSSPCALAQWPCQIKLMPATAPYYRDASLLIAADCTAFAYADIHRDFMDGRITMVGCPKLDAVDYSLKLSAVLSANEIHDITLLRMDVPCCAALERAVQKAISNSGKEIPFTVTVISKEGAIISNGRKK